MHYDFIEIGTCDFNTECRKASLSNENVTGLSVEPVKDYLDRLPNVEGVKKVLGCVSDWDGQAVITYIDPQKAIRMAKWIRGCNQIDGVHPAIQRFIRQGQVKPHDIQQDVVRRYTLRTLFREHGVSSVSYLKLDTEGHDCRILRCYFTFPDAILPAKIAFEANTLTPERENKAMIESLVTMGYHVVHRGRDVIVERT